MQIWHPPRNRHDLPEHLAERPLWLELFYDLVFVAVFIQLGNLLSDHLTWVGVGRVVVLLIPLWWVWSNFTWYMNRFHVDDVWHRLLTLAQIFFVAWMGAGIGAAFGDLSTQFVLCYVGARLTMIGLYARSLPHAGDSRPLVLRTIVQFQVVATILWTTSLLLPPDHRYLLWIAAFTWETYSCHSRPVRELQRRSPIHVGHLKERFGTLVIILLGETFIKNITAEPSIEMTVDGQLFAIPGFLVLFALWWLYFCDAHPEDPDRSPRVLTREDPAAWLYIHLPLSLALIVVGVVNTKLFASVATGSRAPEYVALYLGAAALYCLSLAVIALDRQRLTVVVRLGAAALLAGLIPLALAQDWAAIPVNAVVSLVLGIQVAGEVLPRRIATAGRPRSGSGQPAPVAATPPATSRARRPAGSAPRQPRGQSEAPP